MNASIPAIHAIHFVSLLARWGVDSEAFVEELKLSPEALAQPGARIGVELVERALTRASELTAEPGLGYFFGLQMRASAHGFLGFAAMTSPTLRSAFELIPRFAPTLTDALEIIVGPEGANTTLRLVPRVSLGAAEEVIVTALFVGLWQMAGTITGRPLEGDTEVRFFAPPDYAARFQHLTPRPIRFGAPDHLLRIETVLLETPVLMADPAAQKLAMEQCDRELRALAENRSVKDVVRNLFDADQGLTLSLSDAAKRLRMSDRTLKRRLMEQGTSFVELLEQARRERAIHLLRSPELSLADVAEQVGYTELSNFTRAFRRWTGVTPKRFRNSLG